VQTDRQTYRQTANRRFALYVAENALKIPIFWYASPCMSIAYIVHVFTVMVHHAKYSVIKKDGLNFVRLYFLNYTWYVNDLR